MPESGGRRRDGHLFEGGRRPDKSKTVADQLSTVNDPTLNEIKQYLYNAQQVDDNDKQHMWHKMKTNIDNFDTVRQQSYVDYLHPQMIEFLNSIKQ